MTERKICREVLHTDDAPSAVGPYSQAVRVDRTIYISGKKKSVLVQIFTGISKICLQFFSYQIFFLININLFFRTNWI